MKVYPNIRYTVILLDGKRFPKILRAPAGRVFSAKAVEDQLAMELGVIDKFFPDREFRLVPLGGAKFNFVEMSKEEAELRRKREELRETSSERVSAEGAR